MLGCNAEPTPYIYIQASYSLKQTALGLLLTQ